jgi:hypothetical protein
MIETEKRQVLRKIRIGIIVPTVSHLEAVVSTEGMARRLHSGERGVETMIDNGVNKRIRDRDPLESAKTGNPEASDAHQGDLKYIHTYIHT